MHNYNRQILSEYKFASLQNISLTFDKFDVEPQLNCSYDSLCIFDTETDTSLGCYCGQMNTMSMTFNTSSLYMYFTSDESVQASGFEISYRFVGKYECFIYI